MDKIQQNLVNFDGVMASARSSMFWIAIAIIAGYIACLFLLKDKKTIVNKVFLILGGLYVATAIVLFSVLTGLKNNEDGGIDPLSFYPMLTFAIMVGITAAVFALTTDKQLRLFFGIATLASLIAVFVCLIVYYTTGTPAEKNGVAESDIQTLPLWICTAVLVLSVIGLTFLDKKSVQFDTKAITYAGISVALAFALSYIRILKMPMGGAITLASLLPIMLYSYMFGIKKGVIIGAVYGVLQAIQDPYILHPAQFLLDYPVAFAGIGLAGILRSTKLDPRLSFSLGALIGATFRLLSSFLSGVFAFGSFASYYDMTSPYLYSIAYNATYVLPDAALCIIVGLLLLSSKTILSLVLNTDQQKKAK